MSPPNRTVAQGRKRQPASAEPAWLAHGFVLRVPSLPLAEVVALTDEGGQPRDLAGVAGAARRLLTEPVIREAMYLANPELLRSAEAKSDTGDDPAITMSWLRPLVSYLSRAGSRSTPFGLFAGCAVGSITETTRLQLEGVKTARRRTVLDFGLLEELAQAAADDAELRGVLRYRPNSSLYLAGGRTRMVEIRRDAGRRYHRVAVGMDEALALALEVARDGATREQITTAFPPEWGSRAEIQAYVDDLVAAQVLLPELEPPVTGAEPSLALAEQFESMPSGRARGQALRRIRGELDRYDGGPIGAPIDGYERIAREARSLGLEPQPGRLVHADLTRLPAALTLSQSVVTELTQAAELLWRIASSPAPTALSEFAGAFTERYGDGARVPLSVALDEEVGIGYGGGPSLAAQGSPLLSGLPTPLEFEVEREDALGQLLGRALGSHASAVEELVLDESDLDALTVAGRRPLPDAIAVTGCLLAPNTDAVNAGDYLIRVDAVIGPSGGRLLGRFAHDHAVAGLLSDHLRAEEALRPEAIFAEVVHLPEGRIGNILCRPILRDHEIQFLGRSGAPADRRIDVSDLSVSVSAGRIALISDRLQREVVPRLTTAHNFTGSPLSLYRFLSALAFEGVEAGLSWRWGVFADLPYLPRVRVDRFVLARRQWRVLGPEVADLTAPRATDRAARAIASLQERGVPRWTVAALGDRELLIDMESPIAAAQLSHAAKAIPALVLREHLADPAQLCVSDPRGALCHELLLPLVRSRGPAASPVRVTQPAIQRTFTPGSSWSSIKLYTGSAGVDELLTTVVPEILAALDGVVDRWFFLRYGDPEWHLRLRLHGDESAAGEVLAVVNRATRPAVESGLVGAVVWDTYRREVERYGGPSFIGDAEAIFHADSVAAAGIVADLPGEAGLDGRWRLTLVGLDRLLTSCGLTPGKRAPLLEQWSTALFDEHAAFPALKRHAGTVYRREQTSLRDLLDGRVGEHPGLSELDRRDRVVAPILARADDSNVARSLAHMHVNRMLRSAHRAQEGVLYALLARIDRARSSYLP